MRRLRTLEPEFPGLRAALALVSCEEAVQDAARYVRAEPEALAAEKEHVMVCVRVRVDGRGGLLLADPGYHVARAVTVMLDRAYPHTGWFTQSDEAHCRKEYSYTFSAHNASYVEWRERETRGESTKAQTSLVYVARPYLDGVNVTERRNLVYNFRSLLSRDAKGHLVAGVYFPVGERGRDAQFTLFYDRPPAQTKIKYKFSTFLEPELPEAIAEEVRTCNSLMNRRAGELLALITRAARVMADGAFLREMLEINDHICRLSVN